MKASKKCPICGYKLQGKKAGDRTYCNCREGFWERTINIEPFSWVSNFDLQHMVILKERDQIIPIEDFINMVPTKPLR